MATLPAQTQAVTDWLQIEQVLAGQATYPLAALRRRLADQAAATAPASRGCAPSDGVGAREGQP